MGSRVTDETLNEWSDVDQDQDQDQDDNDELLEGKKTRKKKGDGFTEDSVRLYLRERTGSPHRRRRRRSQAEVDSG